MSEVATDESVLSALVEHIAARDTERARSILLTSGYNYQVLVHNIATAFACVRAEEAAAQDAARVADGARIAADAIELNQIHDAVEGLEELVDQQNDKIANLKSARGEDGRLALENRTLRADLAAALAALEEAGHALQYATEMFSDPTGAILSSLNVVDKAVSHLLLRTALAPKPDAALSPTAAPIADDAERARECTCGAATEGKWSGVHAPGCPAIIVDRWFDKACEEQALRMVAENAEEHSRADLAVLKGELLAVRTQLKRLQGASKAFLRYFNPFDMPEDKSQQWQALHDQANTFTFAALCSTAERAAAIEREIKTDERARIDHIIDHCEPAFIAELANDRETWVADNMRQEVRAAIRAANATGETK